MKRLGLGALVLLLSGWMFAQDVIDFRLSQSVLPRWVDEMLLPQQRNEPQAVEPRRVAQRTETSIVEDETVISTEGTEFWLTMLWSVADDVENVELSILISAKQDALVTVENVFTGWSETVSVAAYELQQVILPWEQCMSSTINGATQTGLLVTSSTPISLYATNFQKFSFDATNVFPVEALSTDYIVQTYYSSPIVAVVATEDETVVDVHPSQVLYPNETLENMMVTLQRGEVLQFVSYEEMGLSGTTIHANKKVAVFNGNICTYVPMTEEACDHLVEQCIPINLWGEEFVVTATKGQKLDVVQLTALADGTVVYKNGVEVARLGARETYEFYLQDPDESCYVKTSKPALCYLYIAGGTASADVSETVEPVDEGEGYNDDDEEDEGRYIGDPSMVLISPIEQRINEITFTTFQTSNISAHYVNVVVPRAAVGAMRLDGRDISSLFSPAAGNSSYYYAQVEISNATHTLSNSEDGFIAHIYGLGVWESYAYNAGSNMRVINSYDINGQTEEIEVVVCDTEEYWFNGERLTESGIYRAELKDKDGNDSIVTINLTVAESKRVMITESTCEYEYEWAGEVYTESGTYTRHFLTSLGCDSTVVMYLSLHSTVYSSFDTLTCDNYPVVWNEHVYTEEGEYTQTLHTTGGCDSIVTMRLRFVPSYLIEVADTIGEDGSYDWQNHVYTETGVYTAAFETKDGCDSIHVLSLYVNKIDVRTAAVADQCVEDSLLYLRYDIHSGLIDSIQIHFEANKGFTDTVVAYSEEQYVELPHKAKPGRYTAELRFTYGGKIQKVTPIEFALLYPTSVLEQAWGDALVVLTAEYNGGYDFVGFQWYKNGQELAGETKSYLYQNLEAVSDINTPTTYQVKLTDKDGMELMTCPYHPTAYVEEVDVYPTVVSPRQVVSIRSSWQGKAVLFDMAGNRVGEYEYTEGLTALQAPAAEGLYMMTLQGEKGDKKTVKLIVR